MNLHCCTTIMKLTQLPLGVSDVKVLLSALHHNTHDCSTSHGAKTQLFHFLKVHEVQNTFSTHYIVDIDFNVQTLALYSRLKLRTVTKTVIRCISTV